MAKTNAVIIARFQTPYLHVAHKHLIAHTENYSYSELIILLGVAPFKSARNPLDFATRKHMVQQDYPHAIILPVYDNKSDIVWSQQVDEILTGIDPHANYILLGCRDSFIPHYHGRFETKTIIPNIRHGEISSTKLRNRVTTKGTQDFREGVIYGYNEDYPRVMPVVDIFAYDEKKEYFVAIKKRGEEKYRLPGGFVNPGESLEEAASREFYEETGILVLPKYLTYQGSAPVNDWRVRGSNQTILSSVFSTELHSSEEPYASDDAEIAEWVSTKLENEETEPEHVQLIEDILCLHK